MYGGPRQKEELARTNGKEILLGVGARKFIAEPAVESRRPRPGWKQGEFSGERERKRESIWTCVSLLEREKERERDRNGSGEMRKVRKGRGGGNSE